MVHKFTNVFAIDRLHSCDLPLFMKSAQCAEQNCSKRLDAIYIHQTIVLCCDHFVTEPIEQQRHYSYSITACSSSEV